ncbi:MAG: hypothetical protein IIA45_07745 [Bacteroidetes bacterium]|nr:hypothetical protein [Bacteroidota bacterium]
MLKQIWLILLLLLPLDYIFAQDSVLEPEPRDSMDYSKVMIIPYNPDFYFSDSDHDLKKYNRKNGEDIRRKFRQGLNLKVNARIMTAYDTKPLLNDTAKDVQLDLLSIYHGIHYKYERTTPSILAEENQKEHEKILANLKQRMDEIKKDLFEEETNYSTYDTEGSKNVAGYIENTDESKYMNVIIHNNDMLAYLADKYDTDLFLFLNQFEIRTNYEHCLDRTVDKFTREVWVHFSIYDRFGKQLYGDVVKVFYPTNTHDMDDIIRNCFPLISSYISDQLPKQQANIINNN